MKTQLIWKSTQNTRLRNIWTVGKGDPVTHLKARDSGTNWDTPWELRYWLKTRKNVCMQDYSMQDRVPQPVVNSCPLGLQGDPTSPFWRRSALGFLWKEWCWSWNSSTLATACEELTHWKRLWCWERLGAGGEGDDRGWDVVFPLGNTVCLSYPSQCCPFTFCYGGSIHPCSICT